MAGREVETHGFGSVDLHATQILQATRHVAHRVAAENADDLIDLLTALGLPATRAQLRIVKARAAIERARKEQQQ